MRQRWGLGIILAACFLLVYSCREYWLAWKADAEPQVITLAQLAENGPGDNYHVRITDFRFGETLIYDVESGDWKNVWIPMIAPGETLPRVVLKVKRSGSASDLALLALVASSGEVQGMVVDDIDSLNYEHKNKLKSRYLGFDDENCRVVEYNRKPAGTLSFLLKFFGSVALAAVGGFVWYSSLKK